MVHSTQTFPYRFIDTTRFVRPYIPVTLRSQKRVMGPLLALVDTGTDFCLFDRELSYLLDLDLAKLEQIKLSGVAGDAIPKVFGMASPFLP